MQILSSEINSIFLYLLFNVLESNHTLLMIFHYSEEKFK